MKAPLLILILLISTDAVADIDIQKLQQLIDSGNSEQAYQYAISERSSYEGDPTFDYYYGIAAIDSGRASEGVFALERVVLIQPDQKAARLELGRGYFILEEYARARQEFEAVQAYDPPTEVRAKIDNYLDAIRLREGRYNTTTTSYVELGLGTDTNVNSGPDSANAFSQYLGFDPLFGTSSVSASSLEQSDSFYDFTGNFGIHSPISSGYTLLGSLTANLRSHSDISTFDTSTITAKGGLQILKANDAYIFNLTLQKFSLDGEDYRDLVGVNSTWKRKISQQTTVNAALQYAMSDFAGQAFRNANTLTLSGGMSSSFHTSLSPVAYFNLYLAKDNADENSANSDAKTERDYFGLRLGTILNTSARTSTHISLSIQQSEYGAADASLTIPLVREDDYINALIDVNWLIKKQWKLIAQLSSTRNSSTLDTGDYSRNQFMLSVRYDIQ
jgi:tetratricopeptide (TPR) repeat protein